MLIVVIVIGLLYALPNLFGEDPAVQITGARGVAASEQTLIQVQKTLQEEKITAKSVALEEGAILARFDSTDTPLWVTNTSWRLTLPRQRRAGWQLFTLSR